MSSPDEDTHLQVSALLDEYNALVDDGKLEQARGPVSRVEELMGRDHGHTLDLRSMLASQFRKHGEYDQAEEIDRDVYQIRCEEYGTDNIVCAESLDNIALDLKGLGLYDEALDLEEQAFAVALAAEGEDSETTKTCMSNLANSYARAGRAQKAAEFHEKVLRWRMAHLGRQDRLTIASVDLLATDYLRLNRVEEAIERQEEALRLAKDSLGEADETALKVAANLCGSYGRLDTADGDRKALEVIEHAYEMIRQTSSENDPLGISITRILAITYVNAGRLADARPLLKTVYDWSRRALGPDHPQTEDAKGNYEYVMEKYGEEQGLVWTSSIAGGM